MAHEYPLTRLRLLNGSVRSLAAVAALVSFLMPIVVAAQAPPTPPPFSLQRVYRVGESDKYRIVMHARRTVNSQPVELAIAVTMKETTKYAGADGVVVLLDEFEDAVLTANGMAVSAPKSMPTLTRTIDASGHVRERLDNSDNRAKDVTKGDIAEDAKETLDIVRPVLASASILLPSHAVTVGQVWEAVVPDGAPLFFGGLNKVPVKCDGVEDIDGSPTVRLLSLADTKLLGGATGTVHSRMALNVDPATGKLIRVDLKAVSDPAQSLFEITERYVAPMDNPPAAAAR